MYYAWEGVICRRYKGLDLNSVRKKANLGGLSSRNDKTISLEHARSSKPLLHAWPNTYIEQLNKVRLWTDMNFLRITSFFVLNVRWCCDCGRSSRSLKVVWTSNTQQLLTLDININHISGVQENAIVRVWVTAGRPAESLTPIIVT